MKRENCRSGGTGFESRPPRRTGRRGGAANPHRPLNVERPDAGELRFLERLGERHPDALVDLIEDFLGGEEAARAFWQAVFARERARIEQLRAAWRAKLERRFGEFCREHGLEAERVEFTHDPGPHWIDPR